MFIRVRDSHVKSFGKAISWRLVGSIDTFLISLLITGNVVAAGSVASLETVSKVVLYYLHERLWSTRPFGRTGLPALASGEDEPAAATVLAQDGGYRADTFEPRAEAPTPADGPCPVHTPAALQQGSPTC